MSADYKAKRTWPPTFSDLSPKHQFQLEKRYRRRTVLKYARPTWMKWTKIAQWSAISFTIGYGILFLKWGDETVLYEKAQLWYNGLRTDVWKRDATHDPSQSKDNGKKT